MELKAQTRENLGKSNAIRKEGLIPAEFYGRNTPNQHITVKKDDFRKIFREAGENTVINIAIGEETQPALIYDVQEDHLSGEILHIDFYKVRMDEKITANIPVEFVGIAPGVKEKGGILNKTISEIEVEALPGDLPKQITVDISSLDDLNKSLHIKDLEFPKGVKVLLDPETVVVSVSEPMKEEEIAPAVPDVGDVKVESEEKKAERDAEKETQATNETK